DGSTAVGEEAGECPFMEGNWLTDCEAEEREEKFRQAVQQLISRLSPASPANTGQGLTDSSSQELTDRSSQELTNRSTPAHGSAPAGPDLAAPLKTVIKTDIKTDIKKLRKKKEFTPDMPSYQLSSLLLEKIKDNIPHFREPNLQDWSHAMDLLLRIDKKDEELVREVILFSQEDDFWLTNIHSPQKLRKHFYQLDMQRRRKRAGPRAPNTRSGTDDWRNESEEYEQFFK
ncbi:MAG: hypothetical protein ABRQ24_03025, partial [Syntrophomonadaceae bacterium]